MNKIILIKFYSDYPHRGVYWVPPISSYPLRESYVSSCVAIRLNLSQCKLSEQTLKSHFNFFDTNLTRQSRTSGAQELGQGGPRCACLPWMHLGRVLEPRASGVVDSTAIVFVLTSQLIHSTTRRIRTLESAPSHVLLLHPKSATNARVPSRESTITYR
jgi:hypothetical protein